MKTHQTAPRIKRASLKNVLVAALTTLLLVFSFWLMFHTFGYNQETREILIGRTVWSDFGAHIPLIRSFSMGDNLTKLLSRKPVEYPIFPGEPIRYHFGFYLVVGLLEKAGLPIDWALNLPSALGFFALLVAIYALATRLFKKRAVGALSVIFFLFNGSLGFIEFFKKNPLNINTPSQIMGIINFPAFAPWGPGDVSAFWNLNIYTNQRHLALAFALALSFILTCLWIEKRGRVAQALFALLWVLILSALPVFHQPTLLIIAIIMATYFFCVPNLRMFLLLTGLMSAASVYMQLVGHSGTQQFALHPGYLLHEELIKLQPLQAIPRMLAYWINNLGLHIILIPVGFFLAPKKAKILAISGFALFLIANLLKFSIEIAANHKFINFSLIIGNMLSAYTIVRLTEFPIVKRPAWLRMLFIIDKTIVVIVLIGLLTLSGIIDLFVIINDRKGDVLDIPKNETANWIVSNTHPGAIFLNSKYLYHPASLAGRPIFLGWPYFAWSAGYEEDRMPIMKTMYEDDDKRCELLKKYHISYITVEEVKGDTNLPRIDLTHFLKTYKPVFLTSDKAYAIFETKTLCPER